jgi:hypothetical protein
VFKKLYILLGLISLAALGIAHGQQSTSTPVGFHTQVIKGNSFSLLAINVANTPDGNLTRTISQTFGPNNESGLVAGLWDEADNIWIPYDGGYLRVYYNDEESTFPPVTVGWRALHHGDADMSQFSLPNSGGIFFESKAEQDWYVTFGGYVKQTAIETQIAPGINVINRGYPADIPLNQSGIDSSLGFTPGKSIFDGDIVWCFREDGTYDRYYYIQEAPAFNPFGLSRGWKKIGYSGNDDPGQDLLSSAFIIECTGTGGIIKLYPPPLLQRQPFITSPEAPPRPIVYPTFVTEPGGVQYFIMYWYAYNANINYHTEIHSPGNWWHLSTQTNLPNQPLNNFAPISLGKGIARVIAEYKDL